jgi:hypothetical protein
MAQQGVFGELRNGKPFHIACKRAKMLERYVVGIGGPTQALAKHVETQAWRAASPKIYSGGVQFWPQSERTSSGHCYATVARS